MENFNTYLAQIQFDRLIHPLNPLAFGFKKKKTNFCASYYCNFLPLD